MLQFSFKSEPTCLCWNSQGRPAQGGKFKFVTLLQNKWIGTNTWGISTYNTVYIWNPALPHQNTCASPWGVRTKYSNPLHSGHYIYNHIASIEHHLFQLQNHKNPMTNISNIAQSSSPSDWCTTCNQLSNHYVWFIIIICLIFTLFLLLFCPFAVLLVPIFTLTMTLFSHSVSH